MSACSKEDLRKIPDADDLHVSPFRDDGMTYGTPTRIWSVVVDDTLLRSWLQRPAVSLVPGRSQLEVRAHHDRWTTKEVVFEPMQRAINDRIDRCVPEKVEAKPYLKPMISQRARSAAVMIMQRDDRT